MNENQIADIWLLFKEFMDRKVLESAAERFVDLLADNGVSEKTFTETLGSDDALDDAITAYIGVSEEDINDSEYTD